jgi:23S rRNA pseudouridine2605 synthase
MTKGGKPVLDLLPAGVTRVAPVGRLDKASEGLLLLTNDSEWGARILDPVSHLDKTYHVQIRMQANEMLIRRLQAGVRTGRLVVAREKRPR